MEKTNKENESPNLKMYKLDWIMAGVGLLALVVLYFFWGCKYDLWVTILTLVVIAAGSTLLAVQHKKLVEKNEPTEEVVENTAQ